MWRCPFVSHSQPRLWSLTRVHSLHFGLQSGGIIAKRTACTLDEECGHGLCNKTECVCAEGWTNSTCDYARKSQKSAFFYGFFLGYWGGGRLYLHLVGSGVVQLLFCVCCVVELIVLCIADDDDLCKVIFRTLAVLMSATVIIWFAFSRCFFYHLSLFFQILVCCNRWLVDVILIGVNHFLDSAGVLPVKNL